MKGAAKRAPRLGSLNLQVNLGPLEQVWRVGGVDYLPLKMLLVAKLIDMRVERLLKEKSPVYALLPTTICPEPLCRSPFQTAVDVRAGIAESS